MLTKVRDADLEKVIGNLLRYGVLASSVVVLAGGIVYLIRHGGQTPQYHVFKGEPEKMRNPVLMWKAMLHGEGRPLIQLGLLILVATPIARIAFSVVGYLLEKDYLYAVLTVIVLLVIVLNF
ncbi:DUF1634 domain-containing protein [Puia dinghuensis]|uniref:DUF1634 domain-containing protein n=1 Tax=Puia dinghuensis TaxID=1792502 RepID=A0A8J2XSA6_9BACT|nr:DUF1634 domain-containing protein [Puia dinghuensis]GGB07597.1 hypothetical protein GCM10011511_33860 [Puia dinghuensis]